MELLVLNDLVTRIVWPNEKFSDFYTQKKYIGISPLMELGLLVRVDMHNYLDIVFSSKVVEG